MNRESLIILIAMLASAKSIPENKTLLLDQVTLESNNKHLVTYAQSLGFLYKDTNSKPTCGVVLVETCIVVTDGSCVPEETDLSKIHILFRVVEDYATTDVYRVLGREDYKNDRVNIVILLMDRKVPLIEGYIYPIYSLLSKPKNGDTVTKIGWDKDWKVTKNDFTIESMDKYEIYLASNVDYECLEQQRGQLLLADRRFAGISILLKYPREHVAYFNLWKNKQNLINLILHVLPQPGTRLYEIIKENSNQYEALKKEAYFCLNNNYYSYK